MYVDAFQWDLGCERVAPEHLHQGIFKDVRAEESNQDDAPQPFIKVFVTFN